MTTLADVTEKARKAWETATPATRTTLNVTAAAIVKSSGRTDSTALGMVEGLIVGDALTKQERSLIIVGLLSIANGWTV